jgi:hypothetical protein
VADDLGSAVLRITVDDGDAREQLAALRQEIQRTSREATTGGQRIRRAAGANAAAGETPRISRENVRRFNLRALNATLESVSEDINSIRTVRNVNLRSNWNKALVTLQNTSEDINAIQSGRAVNLDASWTRALAQLREIKTDLDVIAAGSRLNIRTSWQRALRQLEETAQDIQRAGQRTTRAARPVAAPVSATQGQSQQREQAIRRLGETFLPTRAPRLDPEASQRRAARRAGFGQGVNILGSAAIGAGFPLLFGQGVGAAGGGALGGLVGSAFGGAGGFAGSIIGTAIGQLGDTFTQLAKAVESPVTNLNTLIETSALSGRGVENLAKVLADLGRTAEAEAVIRRDLADRIDPQTFLSVSTANDAYGRSIAEVQQKIGALLAGPAQGFASWLAQITSRVTGLAQGGTGPTERGITALRGQGIALGVGGTLLAGLGLGITAASLGTAAPLGLSLAAGGAGIAGLGATQIGGADFQKQQLQAAKATAPIFEDIARIESRRVGIQRSIAQATLTGNKSQENRLRLEDSLAQIEKERLEARARFLSGPNDESVNRQLDAYKRELEALRIREQTTREQGAREEQVRKSNIRLTETQTAIAVDGIQQQIRAAEQLGSVEIGAAKQALSLRQGVEQDVGDAARRIASNEAALREARSLGQTDEVRTLNQEQQKAAKELERALISGATQLRDAAVLAKENIESAALRLAETQRDPQGLNRFLFPEEASERRRQALASLGPQLNDAIRSASSTLGVSRERFLPLQGILQSARQGFGVSDAGFRAVADFITSARTESNAARDLRSGEQALAAINGELNTSIGGLATQVANLVAKQWDVIVNVSGSSAQLLGDVAGAL